MRLNVLDNYICNFKFLDVLSLLVHSSSKLLVITSTYEAQHECIYYASKSFTILHCTFFTDGSLKLRLYQREIHSILS